MVQDFFAAPNQYIVNPPGKKTNSNFEDDNDFHNKMSGTKLDQDEMDRWQVQTKDQLNQIRKFREKNAKLDKLKEFD